MFYFFVTVLITSIRNYHPGKPIIERNERNCSLIICEIVMFYLTIFCYFMMYYCIMFYFTLFYFILIYFIIEYFISDILFLIFYCIIFYCIFSIILLGEKSISMTELGSKLGISGRNYSGKFSSTFRSSVLLKSVSLIPNVLGAGVSVSTSISNGVGIAFSGIGSRSLTSPLLPRKSVSSSYQNEEVNRDSFSPSPHIYDNEHIPNIPNTTTCGSCETDGEMNNVRSRVMTGSDSISFV